MEAKVIVGWLWAAASSRWCAPFLEAERKVGGTAHLFSIYLGSRGGKTHLVNLLRRQSRSSCHDESIGINGKSCVGIIEHRSQALQGCSAARGVTPHICTAAGASWCTRELCTCREVTHPANAANAIRRGQHGPRHNWCGCQRYVEHGDGAWWRSLAAGTCVPMQEATVPELCQCSKFRCKHPCIASRNKRLELRAQEQGKQAVSKGMLSYLATCRSRPLILYNPHIPNMNENALTSMESLGARKKGCQSDPIVFSTIFNPKAFPASFWTSSGEVIARSWVEGMWPTA
eukprot:990419-Pelagomonas_calceolata.AAC.4